MEAWLLAGLSSTWLEPPHQSGATCLTLSYVACRVTHPNMQRGVGLLSRPGPAQGSRGPSGCLCTIPVPSKVEHILPSQSHLSSPRASGMAPRPPRCRLVLALCCQPGQLPGLPALGTCGRHGVAGLGAAWCWGTGLCWHLCCAEMGLQAQVVLSGMHGGSGRKWWFLAAVINTWGWGDQ